VLDALLELEKFDEREAVLHKKREDLQAAQVRPIQQPHSILSQSRTI
jgi:hypothetical protein